MWVGFGVYAPSNVSVNGKEVELTLPTPAEYGDIVTVTYVASRAKSNAIQDTAGNDAADFNDVSVRNETPNPDQDPPVFDFATVSGATLTMVYDEELENASTPDKTVFEAKVEDVVRAVDVVSVSGDTVVLTLSSPVAWREDVTVSYTKPQTGSVIEDLALNDADNLPAAGVTNNTPSPDQVPPMLQKREVDGAILTLTYNEDLDSGSAPDGSAYTVTVNSTARAVDDVTVTGKVVSLTLSTAVVHGDAVTVAYAVPASNPVRDPYENNAASFSALGVTNNTLFVDTEAPELVGASVNRATLILTYDETLKSSTPDKSAYTVKVDEDTTTHSVSTVSVSGTSVRLVLDKSVERINDVKVSYTAPQTNPIQDDADTPNTAAGFTDYDVTNNTPWDTVPPRPRHAFVKGDTLTLTYNEALDTRSVPGTSAYTVQVNDGTGPTVSRVRVSTVSVVLTLSEPVVYGNVVTLDYEAPTSSPIRDLRRNPAGDLTGYEVTNNTPPGSANAAVGGNNRDILSHEEALMAQGYWPEDINGEVILDTRTRIYIELARELKADETPDIAIFGGGVLDLAGNSNVTEEITPRDGIAPRFTVTVTATAQDRPVANARGEYVVDVRADEDLRRRPVVYFTGIDAREGLERDGFTGTGEYLYNIGGNVQSGGTLTEQADDDHWAKTYAASGLNGFDGLFGLVVYGFDHEDNIGESGGWTPDRHQRTPDIGPPGTTDELDLTEMDEAGVLLEIDREFNGGEAPEFAVTPSRRQRDDETESSNPFVSIRFPLEGEEYAVCPTDGCGGDNPDAEFEDSHARVDITAITLNGRAAMSMLSRVDAGQFALIASGLELGKHEVEYMAVDDAGNVATFEFAFSVVERTPYELSVSPGWNLISFPGTPSDPSLGGVIPPGGLVSPVLAYQNGDWLTAVENEEGEWLGNLTQFEAGFGYWLFTTTFTTLEPLIEEPDQTSVLPSVRVDHGWNLLGVIDIFQNAAGTPPGPEGGDGEADDYFGSVPWRIAYTYETVHSRWVKAVPDADRLAPEGTTADERGFRLVDDKVVTQEILNGKGYWVWSAEPGTLVP